MRVLEQPPFMTRHLASLGILTLTLIVSACAPTPRIVKIGLVAPFEGRYRQIGYDVIPAARLAAREFAALETRRDMIIEIVAYDDQGDPSRAIEQARRLVVDPEVKIVIGHWRDETTQAAVKVYASAGLPLITYSSQDIESPYRVMNLAPSHAALQAAVRRWLGRQSKLGDIMIESDADDIMTIVDEYLSVREQNQTELIVGGPDWGLSQFKWLAQQQVESAYFVTGSPRPGDSADQYWSHKNLARFVEGFKEGSLGAQPGMLSIAAYEATWLAISRVSSGEVVSPNAKWTLDSNFDDTGRLVDQPIYLYQWTNGLPVLVEVVR